MPKEKEKFFRLHIRIDEPTKECVDVLCEEKELTKTQLIEELIHKEFNKRFVKK